MAAGVRTYRTVGTAAWTDPCNNRIDQGSSMGQAVVGKDCTTSCQGPLHVAADTRERPPAREEEEHLPPRQRRRS